MSRLIEIITAQQKGHENEPLFIVGEQLKEIANREPISAELLEKDLEMTGMKLSDAAAKLKKYSDDHRGKATCFCISPKVAEGILREFYGLPKAQDKTTASESTPQTPAGFIDLGAFL